MKRAAHNIKSETMPKNGGNIKKRPPVK